VTNLFAKYDVAGPRYTSYPTVPYWETAPTESAWIAALRAELDASAAKNEGAAIYLHLPFCESLCTFCACNKIITRQHSRARPYIETLQHEWQIYLQKLQLQKIPVSEIHLGGGTPTFMSAAELRDLLTNIFANMNFTPDIQMSFESDPRVTSLEHMQTLYDLGFRRISLGIQDYDPHVQDVINRVQSADMVSQLTNTARDIGYSGVNYDLVFGLPGQTLDGIGSTIETVIAQRPDRIAFYGYAHVPWVGKTGQRKFTDADVPAGPQKRALYERGRELFLAAGYLEIGMDHFALPHDDLAQAIQNKTLFRNFMGYIPYHVSPMIGLGVSAIGDAWTQFSQNEKDIKNYTARVADGELPIARGHVLTAEDLILRRHILNVMTQFETSWQNSETDDLQNIHARLQEFANDNLVEISARAIKITEKGRPFLRNICMAFDARLQRKQPDFPIFSRTI
jgi:oxygen-independent coproporphyrinogen-3 oxidase